MPITRQPAETTPACRLGSHPQLQGEFGLFLYRLAATAGSLGTESKTYYSSSLLLKRNLNDI
jgi:hypothetical protein